MRYVFLVLGVIGCGNDISLVPVEETTTSETSEVSHSPQTDTMPDTNEPTEVEDTGTAPINDTDTEVPVIEDTGTEPAEDTDVPVEEIETGTPVIDTAEPTEPDPCDAMEYRLFDLDGDGHGNPNDQIFVSVCDPWVEGLVPWVTGFDNDCNDDDANVHPDADEVCNDVDDDCDTQIDVNAIDATPWYVDTDGDGYGIDHPNSTSWDCDAINPPTINYVANDFDCDDSGPEAADTFPGAAEYEDAVSCMNDGDGDGWGDDGRFGDLLPAVIRGTDCDDGYIYTHPQIFEWCDPDWIYTEDNNCNGMDDYLDPECN